jgi:hypothetical protein
MEAERQWSTYFGGKVGAHLDPAIPKADEADLANAASAVKQYVDEHVAHTSADPAAPTVTLKVSDVHRAMETVDRLFRRYYSLFTCSSFTTTTPVLQEDFFAVFRQPWMRPGYSPSP